MADKVFSFPGSDSEALALLYIQNLDLSGLSPEDILIVKIHVSYEFVGTISAYLEVFVATADVLRILPDISIAFLTASSILTSFSSL